MTQLTKYQQLKMYLPVNGYDTLKELADEWGVTEAAIRECAREKFTSARLESLIDDFISEGDKKFIESRKNIPTGS